MQKLFLAAATLTSAFLLLGSSAAQQTSSTATKPATSTGTGQAAKPGTTAKPHITTSAKPAQPITLASDKDKLSYALGMNIGSGMKRDGVDVDVNVLAQGLKDALTGTKPLMTEAEAKDAISNLRTQLMAKQQAEMQRVGEANKKEGDQFLAGNKTKPGVVTLPSGLQYKILKEGTGPKPTASDTVVCNYRGTLINGTEFDSSYKRNEPATFPVSGVIKGWTEALQLMPVGSKWQLFLPPDLAYGERGAGADIGPNSTLIFEVELLSIKDKQPASSGEKQ